MNGYFLCTFSSILTYHALYNPFRYIYILFCWKQFFEIASIFDQRICICDFASQGHIQLILAVSKKCYIP